MSGAGMQIVPIFCEDVEANQHNYNSSCHTQDETCGLTVPSQEPGRFSNWSDLIMSTQAMTQSDIQTVYLSPVQARLIVNATAGSADTRFLNRDIVDDIQRHFKLVCKRLVIPRTGLSINLDACEPMDNSGCSCPLISVRDIITRLIYSKVALKAIQREIQENTGYIKIYFHPWRDSLSNENRYRVFCAPGTARITAISQYQWDSQSVLAWGWETDGAGFGEVINMMVEIYDQIKVLHRRILTADIDLEMAALMKKEGFSFDVTWNEDEELCSLNEVNSFGARSEIGSCLFHWIRDVGILYGRDKEGNTVNRNVEFRISLDIPTNGGVEHARKRQSKEAHDCSFHATLVQRPRLTYEQVIPSPSTPESEEDSDDTATRGLLLKSLETS